MSMYLSHFPTYAHAYTQFKSQALEFDEIQPTTSLEPDFKEIIPQSSCTLANCHHPYYIRRFLIPRYLKRIHVWYIIIL